MCDLYICIHIYWHIYIFVCVENESVDGNLWVNEIKTKLKRNKNKSFSVNHL